MRARSRALCGLVAATVLLGLASSSAAGLQGTVAESSFTSAAGTLDYDVYLPPGYAGSGLAYPVVYYLHGLPAGPGSFRTFRYVASALETTGRQAIVVAPQAATAADPDPEYLDWGPGRDWDTALALQLPAVVDAQYRTIADRTGRALVGVSAGGYGATMLALHHLERFSVVESWSGYFHPTDPSGVFSISPRTWLSAHAFVPTLRRAFQLHPTFLAFYVGAGDALFRPENVELARQLSQARVPFVFREYPGGHVQTLWTREAPAWLSMALDHLAAPRPA